MFLGEKLQFHKAFQFREEEGSSKMAELKLILGFCLLGLALGQNQAPVARPTFECAGGTATIDLAQDSAGILRAQAGEDFSSTSGKVSKRGQLFQLPPSSLSFSAAGSLPRQTAQSFGLAGPSRPVTWRAGEHRERCARSLCWTGGPSKWRFSLREILSLTHRYGFLFYLVFACLLACLLGVYRLLLPRPTPARTC